MTPTKPTTPIYVNECREVLQPVRYRDGKAHEFQCPDCGAWHPWRWKVYHDASAAYRCLDCAETGEAGGDAARALPLAS